jgi:hypothetical protein
MPLTFTLGTTVLRQRRSKALFQYPKQFRRVLERGDAFLVPLQVLRGEHAPFRHKHQHGHVKSQLSGDADFPTWMACSPTAFGTLTHNGGSENNRRSTYPGCQYYALVCCCTLCRDISCWG